MYKEKINSRLAFLLILTILFVAYILYLGKTPREIWETHAYYLEKRIKALEDMQKE